MASESDYLTPANIEAASACYCERAATVTRGGKLGWRHAEELCRWLGRTLRHLRALAAPADGEALGRDLFFRLHPPTGEPVVRRDWEKETRAPWVSAALHLHAIGHAAGALSREGEIAALRAEIDRREQDRAEGVKDIDRLRGHLDLDMLASVNECADEGARLRREVERLTAELADRDATHAETIDAWQEASGADTPDELRGLLDGDLARARNEADTARADGAREERDACAEWISDVCAMPVVAMRLRRARGDR